MKKTLSPTKMKRKQNSEWLWQGPLIDGITSSLLSKFIICHERFRLLAQYGKKESHPFNPSMEYGTIFHNVLEGSTADKVDHRLATRYVHELMADNPPEKDRMEIIFLLSTAIEQAKSYFDHYKVTESKRIYHAHEHEFDTIYTTRNGVKVRLRGKIDAIFSLRCATNKGNSSGAWIQETKTKGRFDQAKILQSLHWTLQPMLYLVALQNEIEEIRDSFNNLKKTQPLYQVEKLCGICYNIIRRPFGDQSSIKRRKKETNAQFLDRAFNSYEGSAQMYPINAKRDQWFYRLNVPISEKQIYAFKDCILDPWLEYLDSWYSYAKQYDNPFCNPYHLMRPFGIYDSLANGFDGDYFDLITTGNQFNLDTVDNLYPELG